MRKTKTELRRENRSQREVKSVKKNRKILNYKCSIKFPYTLSFALVGKTKRKTKKNQTKVKPQLKERNEQGTHFF